MWTPQEQHRLPAFHVLLQELHDILARTLPACATMLRAFDAQWETHYVGFKHQQVSAARSRGRGVWVWIAVRFRALNTSGVCARLSQR